MNPSADPAHQGPTMDAGSLSALYLEDETAWLDIMAAMVRDRNLAGLDLDNLVEFLTDAATRNRRAIHTRLYILLANLLRWKYEPEKRSRKRRSLLLGKQQRFSRRAQSRSLRLHAEASLSKTYANAIKLAIAATGLPRSTFPEVCPYTVDQLLSMNLTEGEIA